MKISISTDGVGTSMETRIKPEEEYRKKAAIIKMIRVLLAELEKN